VLIVDAGPLIASMASGEADHQRCAELLSRAGQPLQVPAFVAAEVAHIVDKRLGPRAELAFARAFAMGELFVEPVEPQDWDRITELMEQYIDMPLGITDASVVALAERLGARTIATLDRRHFATVRPGHVEQFELVP
jgi:predicted nucleic acid-binding protein